MKFHAPISVVFTSLNLVFSDDPVYVVDENGRIVGILGD